MLSCLSPRSPCWGPKCRNQLDVFQRCEARPASELNRGSLKPGEPAMRHAASLPEVFSERRFFQQIGRFRNFIACPV